MRLRDIDDWIALVRASHYDLSELAHDKCGVSDRHLRRWFSLVAFRGPQEWLDEVRLWEAARLLCTDLSVKEVLGVLHFRSHSHFSRRFKHYFGCTPSRFRLIVKDRARLKHLKVPDSESSNPWTTALQILNSQPKGRLLSTEKYSYGFSAE